MKDGRKKFNLKEGHEDRKNGKPKKWAEARAAKRWTWAVTDQQQQQP